MSSVLMKFVYARQWDSRKGDTIAFWITAVLFSGLALLLAPRIDDGDTAAALVKILVGAVSLALVFSVTRYLVGLVWSWPFRGEWIYDAKLRNEPFLCATAQLKLCPDGALAFSADLYRSHDELKAARRGDTAIERVARLTSRSVVHDPAHDKLWILYEIRYDAAVDAGSSGGQTREGHIHLMLPGDPSEPLEGTWQSNNHGVDFRWGRMAMVRPRAGAMDPATTSLFTRSRPGRRALGVAAVVTITAAGLTFWSVTSTGRSSETYTSRYVEFDVPNGWRLDPNYDDRTDPERGVIRTTKFWRGSCDQLRLDVTPNGAVDPRHAAQAVERDARLVAGYAAPSMLRAAIGDHRGVVWNFDRRPGTICRSSANEPHRAYYFNLGDDAIAMVGIGRRGSRAIRTVAASMRAP